MALTEIKTSGIADDAVTTDKLANAINTARDANTAKATNATHSGDVTGSGSLTIADNAVTLAKMAGGTDGQIITYDASGDPVAVGPGTDGQVLTSTGAGSPPAFEAIPTQISLANDANNRVITGTGSGLNGEANLTFDGTKLEVTGTTTSTVYINAATHDASTANEAVLKFGYNQSHANDSLGHIKLIEGGVNSYDGNLAFGVPYNDSGTPATREALRILHSGNVGIGTSSPAHKLHVESAASGVISAKQTTNNGGYNIYEGDASDGTTKFYVSHNGRVGAADGIIFGSDTAAANVLEDYEEGGFTPSFNALSTGTIGVNGCYYVKIGDLVHFQAYIDFSNTADSDNCEFNAPFSCADSHSWSPFTTQTNRGGTQYPICCRTSQGSTTIQVKKLDGDNAITYSDLNGYWMIFAGTYRTDD